MRALKQSQNVALAARLAVCLFTLALLAAGCSFVMDFEECTSQAECAGFDSPQDRIYYACSPSNKCVVDDDRECRQDKHCEAFGAGSCDEEAGKCVAD